MPKEKRDNDDDDDEEEEIKFLHRTNRYNRKKNRNKW